MFDPFDDEGVCAKEFPQVSAEGVVFRVEGGVRLGQFRFRAGAASGPDFEQGGDRFARMAVCQHPRAVSGEFAGSVPRTEGEMPSGAGNISG